MPTGGNWKQFFKGAETGDFELVNYYLKMEMDPNYQHPEVLTTPLIESAHKGHLEIVKLLLQNGADPHLKASLEGWTALEAAQHAKQEKVVAFLSQHLGLDYQPPISPKEQNGQRKKKALKISSFINAGIFFMGAFSFITDGKLLFGILPFIAAILNSYLGFLMVRDKKSTPFLNLGITIFSIFAALTLAMDYYQQGTDYLHLAWILVAVISLLAYFYKQQKNQSNEA